MRGDYESKRDRRRSASVFCLAFSRKHSLTAACLKTAPLLSGRPYWDHASKTIVEPRLSVEQMSLWSAARCKNGNWKIWN